MQLVQCPVCNGKSGGSCKSASQSFEGGLFECEVCGSFKASRNVLDDTLLQSRRSFSDLKRSALSHYLRRNQNSEGQLPFIESDWLEVFIENARLPSPSQQATNLIRFIGDNVLKAGEPLKGLPISTCAQIGSPSRSFAHTLAKQLIEVGLVEGISADTMQSKNLLNVNLTLAGWEKYESEKVGKSSSGYGFLAMKFNDDTLENFARKIVKPSIARMGMSLVDIRDVARPGIIDNILREQIRDAAFVIVDLTHDNAGAYWEAGFAEGLGKPVLYICEQDKFDKHKTHFDTNHCTTVTWGGSKSDDDFEQQLKATLRNALRRLPH